MQAAYGRSDYYGLFYGGGGRLLACQVVGLLTIAAWVTANMTLFFTTFKVSVAWVIANMTLLFVDQTSRDLFV